ncbi:MAG: YlbF family regulator [Halobacteriaceae archaeon]
MIVSVDQEPSSPEQDQDIEALGRELGETIASLPVYEEFEDARQAVRGNDELQEQIDAFEEQRREFMMARQTGEASETQMAELQRAQQELHDHPDMARFLAAKEELQDRLEAANEAISEPLAVDFGGEAGGCCQDD